MKKYEEDEILKRLKNLEGWDLVGRQISKEVKLKDFKTVMTVVNKIADEAEKMDHHPNILIHSWNKLTFILHTHSEDGITDKDFSLAGRINLILQDT